MLRPPPPGRAGIQRIVFDRATSPPAVNKGQGWRADDVRAFLRDRQELDGAEISDAGVATVWPDEDTLAGSETDLELGDATPELRGVRFVFARSRQQVARSVVEMGTGDREERSIDQALAEVRLEGSGAAARIQGHAAVWDRPTTLWPGYKEVVRRGAFTDSLRDDDVFAFFNHDDNVILGRKRSGTLRLWEDDRGLAYEIRPPETRTVDDLVLAPMRRGDLDGSSFGFRAEDAPESHRGDHVLRELRKVRLIDVSPVALPAYSGATAALRKAHAAADVLEALRSADLTDPQIARTLRASLEQLGARSGPDPSSSAAALREAVLEELEVA